MLSSILRKLFLIMLFIAACVGWFSFVLARAVEPFSLKLALDLHLYGEIIAHSVAYLLGAFLLIRLTLWVIRKWL